MAKYPSMPLFPDAWIADTQHLTNEEQGVYFRLVMFAWRTPSCALPDDDRRLAKKTWSKSLELAKHLPGLKP